MKSIKTFVAVIALATSFGSFAAQTVTASASTLDGAEAKIAAQAEQAGASSYKIFRFSGRPDGASLIRSTLEDTSQTQQRGSDGGSKNHHD